MVNGYKEVIMIDLLKAKHPLTFEELSDDISMCEMDRFKAKLYRLIQDGWVFRKDNKYWLTEKGQDIIWPQEGVE